MRKTLLLFISFLFFGTVLFAQKVITGKVTDTNGLPLAGVSVKSKKTGKGIITSADGTYRLSVPENDELEITMVGYLGQTIKTDGSGSMDVKLVLDNIELGQVVLVGTRSAGRVKTQTPVPVDVVNVAQASMPTARMDLTSILNFSAPSFNYNKQSGSDGADHIDLATLRGLGPDQTLVLINGKRRHQTAFVAVFGTRGRGNSGTDLNALPASAIDRVEILRDGASAQYGSDAIAGVINLVLRKNTDKVNINAGWAAHYDPKFNTAFGSSDLKTQYESSKKSDGRTFSGNLNFGVALGKKGGFVNMTLDGVTTNKTFRQALKTDNYITDDEAMYINIYRRGHGDASLDMVGTFINSEVPLSDKTSFYAFAGYNHKSSDAFAFTRNFSARPGRFPTDAMGGLIFIPSIMKVSSDGETYYSPHIQTKVNDVSATGGVKGVMGKKWNWDLSNTFGRNNFHFYGDKTFNASVGPYQKHFDDGGFSFNQNTTNLNVSKQLTKTWNLGLGLEFRHENVRGLAKYGNRCWSSPEQMLIEKLLMKITTKS